MGSNHEFILIKDASYHLTIAPTMPSPRIELDRKDFQSSMLPLHQLGGLSPVGIEPYVFALKGQCPAIRRWRVSADLHYVPAQTYNKM
jgi:hypothetical protein